MTRTRHPGFAVVFLMIAAGNSLLGLLTSRPARMLGIMSYSFHLTHNFVLYLASRLINHTSVASLSITAYWIAAAAVVAIVTTALSALTYRYIEYPFLSLPLRQKIRPA